VLRLARGIYEDRAFEQMPILADALEEAGCGEPAILGHCRAPAVADPFTGTALEGSGLRALWGKRGDHVRGCHLLDLVLVGGPGAERG
jgi:hypothetical protein